jgi:hypothetical protein
VPASNTAVGHIILEPRKRGGKAKAKGAAGGSAKRPAKAKSKMKRAAARQKVERVRS